MAFRRGFKAEANRYSRELREELGILAHEPLCPWGLADHLAIPVIPLSEFTSIEPASVNYLLTDGAEEFSAVSVFQGTQRIIIHNEAHHPNRQSANIAHEISHALLMHPPTPPFKENGERHYDAAVKAFEEEANWLGPALLISEEAAMHIVKNKIPIVRASEIYKASEQLINMRVNVTGARKRATGRGRRKF